MLWRTFLPLALAQLMILGVAAFITRKPVQDPFQLSHLKDSEPSSSDESSVVSSKLDSRFLRWRFLQKVLDEETPVDDMNSVLYRVLRSYLAFAVSTTVPEGSPELTSDRKETLQELLQMCSSSQAIPTDENDKKVFELLERLLPDPDEDEDGHKTTWDTVLDLHGREAVKISERSPTNEWKVRRLVARLLIYYDFLANGVGEGDII